MRTLDVVGIHAGSLGTAHESAAGNTADSKATNIQAILNAFTKYVLKMLNGKTENELWLEKINMIPPTEFQLIGSGGYGQVYKIKVKTESTRISCQNCSRCMEHSSDYEPQIRALEKEYRLVSSLDNHPRIIQFFAFVPDVNKLRIMIVMEYLAGGSLADKLKDHKPLSNYKVHKYLVQILDGLDFLHQRNIYHSDIKPANILFTEQDNIKICDFGIAVELQTESSATSSHMKGTYSLYVSRATQ